MRNPVASASRRTVVAFRRTILAFRRTILLLALLVAAISAVEAQVIDRIMAAVNGQTIMLSDVNAAIEFGLIVPPAGTADPLAFVLDRLIERTLILAEVERFQPPEPDPIEITIRIDEIQKRLGPAAFEKTLKVTGSTREDLQRFLRNDLRMATYLNQRFGDVPERPTAIATWVGELRRRADVTMQYKGR
jgi:hypothetical protein